MTFKQTRDRKIKVSCDVKQCCVQHSYRLVKGAYFLPAQWQAVQDCLTLDFTTRSFFETSTTIYYSTMCKKAKDLLCSQLHPCEEFSTLEKAMLFFPHRITSNPNSLRHFSRLIEIKANTSY